MNIFKKVFKFYFNGFKNMPKWGRILWTIILLKGIIVFIIVKFTLFPNYLKKNFETDQERSEHVIDNLTNINR